MTTTKKLYAIGYTAKPSNIPVYFTGAILGKGALAHPETTTDISKAQQVVTDCVMRQARYFGGFFQSSVTIENFPIAGRA